jgi:hypothetical protein
VGIFASGVNVIQKILVGLMILFGCLLGVADGNDTWIFREDGVGAVKVGVTLAQLRTTLRQTFHQKRIQAATIASTFVRVATSTWVS